MKRFQSHINNMILDINDVCICCSLFILFGFNTWLTKVYLDFIMAMEAAVIAIDNLDHYRHTNNDSHFSKSYYSMIVEKMISKFGSAKYINVLPCQKNFDVLSDLTSIKEAFITCAHPIISVIKLILSRTDLTNLYYKI